MHVRCGKEAGMDEKDIKQAFSYDFSEGTEAFRDDLLARCLTTLQDCAEDEDEGIVLEDEELDMLAAAGDIYAQMREERQ